MKSVFCPKCSRVHLVEPPNPNRINRKEINAGHANVVNGSIQCVCGQYINKMGCMPINTAHVLDIVL